ncbi:MAG: hypothetical protein DELT_01378 [Desulfovibrio sp.]
MPASVSLSKMGIWPTLAETFQDFSRKDIIVRETSGADVNQRALDRANGMERTSSGSYDQYLFGGITAGKSMDWVINGNFVARDNITQTTDGKRGILTMHLHAGNILDSSV